MQLNLLILKEVLSNICNDKKPVYNDKQKQYHYLLAKDCEYIKDYGNFVGVQLTVKGHDFLAYLEQLGDKKLNELECIKINNDY